MELGNMAFGNSRGEFEVERDDDMGAAVYALLEAVTAIQGIESFGYQPTFDSPTFSLAPYWWGDCTCGWDCHDDGHSRSNAVKHAPNCYRHEYGRLEEESNPHESHERRMEKLKPIYKKFGWDTESENWWHGCALRCSCDFDRRFDAVMTEYAAEFGHEGHKPDCKLVVPNFFHKPSGYVLKWYKYPLRDSYENQDLSKEEFLNMIQGCIDSLGR